MKDTGKAALQARIPRDLKIWLEKQASLNASSLNSEIVRCVRERMERLGKAERVAE